MQHGLFESVRQPFLCYGRSNNSELECRCEAKMKAAIFVFAVVLSTLSNALSAAAIPKGRFEELKMYCDTCHGANGISPVPDQVPSIAGKNERYLKHQLQAFRSGKRQHEVMLIMGRELTDDELEAMARYYSHLRK
jgi:cytochrome c553